MATIKVLEGRTVHQIQAGQVIVDLCSVVKELVENSLDAGATSIEVRFRNHGLDSIEVQDNGVGISNENFETVALKHFTSKLASYDDLSSLQTFGFRGEALSSLCALSNFHIVTAREGEAPKGTKLSFEDSGKLKSASIVASQKGTTVTVDKLFVNLPVRRRELEKNIKREYGKVLSILQAYACISTQARISVSNIMAKGKRAVVFATRSNTSTRDNIANVFGAKTLPTLVGIDLSLEMESTHTISRSGLDSDNKQIRVVGHVSRPVFGEGRQAPDRQMFFVNSRPCSLPQVAKVFNEVYKSYNMSQSPFIFANILLDTNAYDVNISPDKRTILLHEQAKLLESLKASLTGLFERQDQTVPHAQHPIIQLPSFKQLTVSREASTVTDSDSIGPHIASNDGGLYDSEDESSLDNSPFASSNATTQSLIGGYASRGTTESDNIANPQPEPQGTIEASFRDKQMLARKWGKEVSPPSTPDELDNGRDKRESDVTHQGFLRPMQDFNQRLAEKQGVASREGSEASSQKEAHSFCSDEMSLPTPTSSIVQNAFNRMRPRRKSPEVATITIGSKTTKAVLGSSTFSQRSAGVVSTVSSKKGCSFNNTAKPNFSSSMQAFAAPGTDPIRTVGAPKSKSCPSNPQLGGLSDEEASAYTSSSGETTVNEDREQDEEEDQAPLQAHASVPEKDEGVDQGQSEPDSDVDYVDEDEKKAVEDAKVQDMIRQAEESAALASEDNNRRAKQALRGSSTKDSTTELLQKIDISIEKINQQLCSLRNAIRPQNNGDDSAQVHNTHIPVLENANAADGQTLTITKSDFRKMHIIGQFNLGFILATRNNSDLFIIDQHASDEKISFERLQATTVMQNQRLVHPRRLELTAVDEEIVRENQDALLRNGFVVDVDDSGDVPVGQRVSLTSLPMSKETTFTPSDLEELLALLADSPIPSSSVPRPTKIRKLLAMRACRSSIMIGKVMTRIQMQKLVSKMGEIDKPWNCPHGRPTMRHVCGLEGYGGYREGEEDGEEVKVDWKGWIERTKGTEGEEDVADAGAMEDIEDVEEADIDGEQGSGEDDE
ncbi:MAG: hypothetical protein Q9217_000495 [Psora testacea]